MPSITHQIAEGGPFPPEKGRYVLYVGWFCPFATRVSIMRSLKGLESIVELVATNSIWDPARKSWSFRSHVLPDRPEVGIPGDVPEPFEGAQDLRELYERSEGPLEGPYVVPMLWDKKTKKVVNNESASLLRMFSTAFNSLLPPEKAAVDLYPEALRAQIDELYSASARDVYGGVYRAGFSTRQADYDSALDGVHAGLDRLEAQLEKSGGPFLLGDRLTEVDVTTFTTAVRYDVAYVGAFGCNERLIRTDYPRLHRWLRELYWNHAAFRDSTRFDVIKSTYFSGMSKAELINPRRVVPRGPKEPILRL